MFRILLNSIELLTAQIVVTNLKLKLKAIAIHIEYQFYDTIIKLIYLFISSF